MPCRKHWVVLQVAEVARLLPKDPVVDDDVVVHPEHWKQQHPSSYYRCFVWLVAAVVAVFPFPYSADADAAAVAALLFACCGWRWWKQLIQP